MADSAQEQKRAVFGWVLYDWANSAFATTIMAAILPVYYSTVAAATLAPSQATAYWGFTTSLAALLAALVGPVLGAVADFKASKKRFLFVFMTLGATATAFLFFVRRGDWPLASALFVLGNLGFAGSLVFYDALLPHVASEENVDQVSSRGFAMGYAGGGILLAINIAMIELAPRYIQLLEGGLMIRLSFVTVAAWWVLFSIPIFLFVSEPPRRVFDAEAGLGAIRVAFRRLAHTARSVRQYRDLSLFLLASWLYFNGIGTIIVMATVYGAVHDFFSIQ